MSSFRPPRRDDLVSHFWMAVGMTAGAAVFIVAVPYLTVRTVAPSLTEPLIPADVEITTDLRSVPKTPKAVLASAAKGVERTLRSLYQGTFLAEHVLGPLTSSKLSDPFAGVFTDRARKAIAANAELFLLPPTVTLLSGTLDIDGAIVFARKTPLSATVRIKFDGQGPRHVTRQRGDLDLVYADDSWAVSGFALKTVTEPR